MTNPNIHRAYPTWLSKEPPMEYEPFRYSMYEKGWPLERENVVHQAGWGHPIFLGSGGQFREGGMREHGDGEGNQWVNRQWFPDGY